MSRSSVDSLTFGLLMGCGTAVVVGCAAERRVAEAKSGPSTPSPARSADATDAGVTAVAAFASELESRRRAVLAAAETCGAETTSTQEPCAALSDGFTQQACRDDCRRRIERAQVEREAIECAERARVFVTVRCNAPAIGYWLWSPQQCADWCRALLRAQAR